MDIHLRAVEEDDAKALFDWRMDATTREFARNTGEFQFESHLKWLTESLSNPNRVMYMALNKVGDRVGQIRFDRNGNMAEIDIAVSPAMRGKGVGTELLRKGCHTYLSDSDVECLIAEVNRDNIASIKIFENGGFHVHEETAASIRMILRR